MALGRTWSCSFSGEALSKPATMDPVDFSGQNFCLTRSGMGSLSRDRDRRWLFMERFFPRGPIWREFHQLGNGFSGRIS